MIQLTSPDSQPNFYGFSPEPQARAHRLAQDRVGRRSRCPRASTATARVDETGNQIAVFGRLGSRPFTLPEMQELYLDVKGMPWYVTDEVRMQDLLRALPAAEPSASPARLSGRQQRAAAPPK